MEVKVRFRYNKRTGEVEIFEVDDLGSTLTYEEHNRQHDRIASEIGTAVVRNPRIVEVTAEAESPAAEQTESLEDGDRSPTRVRQQ